MRPLGRLVLVCLLVSLVGSCDSIQPLQGGTQRLAITVSAINALVTDLNVYDSFQDNDADGQPDDVCSEDPTILCTSDSDCSGTCEPSGTFLFCQRPNNPQTFPASGGGVPFSFDVEVRLIRAGETASQRISSDAALSGIGNMTGYDPTVRTLIALPKPPITEAGRTFVFRNPRRLTTGNASVVASTTNPLFELDPDAYGYGNGLCSLLDLGPAVFDGEPMPREYELAKGDTVIVTLRRGDFQPMFVDNTGQPLGSGSPSVSAEVSVDGRGITPNGNVTTSSEAGSTVTFSFTSR